jgi:hypothetical protein
MSTVKIPSDIDLPDVLLWGLTARQVAILGATGLFLGAGYLALTPFVSPFLLAVPGALAAAAGVAVAFARPDGVAAERWLHAGMRYLTSPRKRVLAPEGTPEVPSWAASKERIAPLDFPVTDVDDSGVVELGRAGCALVCRASAINFALCSEAEQQGLIEGFGRLLNALDSPVSFVVRSERADLRPHVEAIENAASGLSTRGLEVAARSHAAFLASLAARRDVLRREVYLVLRSQETDREQAAAGLLRRADDARGLLRGMGIRIQPLSGAQVAEVLARASEPDGPLPLEGQCLPGEIVVGAAG